MSAAGDDPVRVNTVSTLEARFGIQHARAPRRVARALRAEAVLPDSAAGEWSLRAAASGAEVRVRALGVRDVPAVESDGALLYEGALPDADVVLRAHAGGVEDYAYFAAQPRTERLSYRIELGPQIAGLRLVERSLELLSAAGTPLLRVSRPYFVDAAGGRGRVELSVRGCAVDESPVPPWGRAPVPPGASACVVDATWHAPRDHYPLVVDPNWVTAGTMTGARALHGAVRLQDGRVLVAGGVVTSAVDLDSAEIFDPTTETWAATGSLPAQTRYPQLALLQDGDVLAFGGQRSLLAVADSARWSASTGTWVATNPLQTARTRTASVALSDGRVLVLGGCTSDCNQRTASVEQFDPSLNSWSAHGVLTSEAAVHRATLLQDERVLITGGIRGTLLAPTFVAEFYDPGTGTGVRTTDMPFDTLAHIAQRTADGSVVVGTGCTDINCSALLGQAARFIPGTETWTVALNMPSAQADVAAALLPTGQVLVAGGQPQGYTQLYAIGTGWTSGPPSSTARISHTLTSLSDGRVLLAGGDTPAGVTDNSEIWDPNGCETGSDCTSGFCVDGVCCDTACDGPCQACTTLLKGDGANGVCGPTPAGGDPDDDCPDSGSTCGTDGTCDGTGACRLAAAGVTCGTSSCADATTEIGPSECDGAGNCVAPTPSACPPGATCASISGGPEECAATCVEDAQNTGCAATHWCDGGTCRERSVAGVACADANECASGFCSDGVCCATACDGTCMACSADAKGSGADGECGPVAADTDPRDDCADEGANSCRRNGTCDGAGGCQLYAAATACGTPVCASAERTVSECNGEGACVARTSQCRPYVCGAGDACASSCAGDDGCVQGFVCRGGACVAPTTECSDDGTSEVGPGGVSSCEPYLCNSATGTCRVACSESSVCASGFSCDTDTKTCIAVEQAPPPSDSGGCGCSVPTERRELPVLPLALGALLALRRRKRHGPVARALSHPSQK